MLLDKYSYCPVCGSQKFTANSNKSKVCGDCGFELYMNPSSANAAIITNQHGEMLVVRRKKDPAKGTLDLPGGFADAGETVEEGVCREVKEETGLHVTRAEYLFSQPNLYVYSGLTIPTLDLFFRCHVDNITDLKAADDADECLWIPIKEINPADFGLHSIRTGVEKFIADIRL
uniref:NUDIX domain-containing protein n=1 Tax=Prevotella sp. GTC17259 TaxID=3236795 RepID=A0AB33J472_9BACT